jgi:hypothetical protein
MHRASATQSYSVVRAHVGAACGAHLRDLLPETAIASVLLAGVAWMLPIPLTLLVMRRQDCVLLRGLATTPSGDAPALKGGTRRTM